MSRLLFIQIIVFTLSPIISKGQVPKTIDIMRDRWGVPHIHAPTDKGVSYGLAWAHAEDDFKTIQLTLLGAKQMLGRHLGKSGAQVDYVVGLLRCDDIVDDQLAGVSTAFRSIVAGYAAGLNAYARCHPEEVLLKNAFPIDERDLFRAYILQLAVMDGADKTIQRLFSSEMPGTKQGIGSNAIAISRKKTADEYSYLAVNSHQPLEGPAAWYEAHLVSDEGWNAMGGLFPGGPVIFHGTNEHLGWAHTVNYPDKVDVFELGMHPTEKNRYRMDDQWLALETRKVKLKVKFLFGIPITVRKKAFYSIYGPTVKNKDGVFAFKMGVLDEMKAIEQWYEMNKAKNLDEFKAILSNVRIPSFNIVYADKYGEIFYVSNGLFPHRKPEYDWQGTVPGNTKNTLSNGYHPFSDLPQVTNPECGYVFNMNNSPFNATDSSENVRFEDIDPTMGFHIRENNRSIRMGELMREFGDQEDPISWEEFVSIKYDAQLPDSLHYAININPLFKKNAFTNDKARQVAEMVVNWDKRALSDREGPAQLLISYQYLKESLHKDSYANPSLFDYEDALSKTYDYLLSNFGKIDITLGEYQKLVRGSKELPLSGIPDVITAMKSTTYRDGKVKGIAGESYIMLVRYHKDGLPIIETVNVYGASNKSENPHYDDQMELFINQERKSMTLDIEEVRKNAIKIYHPE